MNRAARRAAKRSTRPTIRPHRVMLIGATGAMVAAGAGIVALPGGQAASGAPSAPAATSGGMLAQNQALAAGVYTEQKTTTSAGATTYTYTFPSGLTVTSITPPAGFQPLAATNTELERYGLPPRPTSAQTLAAWTSAMASWRETVTPDLAVETLTGPASKSSSGSSSDGTGDADTITGTNWAGYYDETEATEPIIGAQSTFAAPTVGRECSTTIPAGIAVWTGIGGVVDRTRLIQSGIQIGKNLTGAQSTWQPFWEIFTSRGITWPIQGLKSSTQDELMSIEPGDAVFSETYYSTDTGGEIDFTIENETSGAFSEYILRTNPLTGSLTKFYTGRTADFIVEDPTGNRETVPFSEFAMTQDQSYKDGGWGSLKSHGPNELKNTTVTIGTIGATDEAFAAKFMGC